jgi:hypothetical protein
LKSKYLLIWLLSMMIAGCASQQTRSVANVNDSWGDEFPSIEFEKLKKVDVLGIPFGDTVLNEMRTDRNIGVNNVALQDDFILRFAHLAEQFSRDLEKMGMQACYLGRNKDLKADYRDYQSNGKLIKTKSLIRVARDFWAARYCFLQQVRFPSDVEWRNSKTQVGDVEMPRVITLFLPNVLTVNLETNGTWPFGHRPNDQIGGRFTALFLKMGGEPGDCSGQRDLEALRNDSEKLPDVQIENDQRCHLESLIRPVSNGHHGFQSNGGLAIPIQPPKHIFVDENGKTIVGIPEEEFPFLLPPNPGRGYYQSSPGSGLN